MQAKKRAKNKWKGVTLTSLVSVIQLNLLKRSVKSFILAFRSPIYPGSPCAITRVNSIMSVVDCRLRAQLTTGSLSPASCLVCPPHFVFCLLRVSFSVLFLISCLLTSKALTMYSNCHFDLLLSCVCVCV